MKGNLEQYDNESYWIMRGKGYKDEFARHKLETERAFRYQEQRLVQELDNLKFDSVLEVGCGFGRITKLISERYQPKVYDAFDISPDQIDNAKRLNLNVNYSVSTIKNFEIKRTYDLVIASEVLMHIPFTDIFQVMQKLSKASHKYIVNIDWFTGQKTNKNHCYSHNYSQYYMNLGLNVVSTNLNNSIFDRVIKKLPRIEQTVFIAAKYI